MDKLKWHLVKQIVRMCHEFNGTIFGGAARDAYIHDYDARKFCLKYDLSQYNDMQITEFSGRFVVPNDVDCIILAQDHEKLLTALHHKFHIRATLDYDATYTTELDVPSKQYQFKRYSIVSLQDVPVVLQLDMIIQVNGDKLLTPFRTVDMDVNALWWTKDSMIINPNEVRSIGSSHDIYTHVFGITYTTLFENILSKKATICTSRCPSRRILKMKKQGWNIHYEYNDIIIFNEPYDGVCVLCQDTIVGDHSTFRCKCAHICMTCLRKHYASLHRCTICKMPVDAETLYNDVRIYSAIHHDIDM